MGYALHLRNFRLPDVDQSSIVQDRVTYFSVIELPFRLRLGRYSRNPIYPGGADEIAWLNRVDLPKRNGYAVENLPLVRDRHLLNTRLIVIENVVTMKADEVDEIRQAKPFPLATQAAHLLTQQPDPQLLHFPNPEKPLSVIRRFIDLYHTYCPPMYGGDMVRPIWLHDYLSFGIVSGICLRSSNTPLPDSFVKVLLSSDNPLEGDRDMEVSFRQDAPVAQRRRFIQSLKDGEEPPLANQLLLLSYSYQEQHNMDMAVITAVAALEAALFIFARKRLEPKLGKSLTETFLREQGAYMLVEALPRLLFLDKNMPTAKTFESVKKAITARNHIMHGKVDHSGKPKHLNMGHLGTEISACRELIKIFQRES